MCPLRASSALLLLAAGSAAQVGLGDDGGPTGYFNPESPQVKPIAVGRLASGVELVFACNTPDNAVCVFAAADMQPLQRVPVGQEPVSVVWSDAQQAFYTCDMLGDSVTRAEWSVAAQAFVVTRSRYVGDEPMHLAELAGSPSLLAVSLQTSNQLAFVDAVTLAPATVPEPRLLDAARQKAMTYPRNVLAGGFGTADGVTVLGHRGAQNGNGVALYYDATPGSGTPTTRPALGTTNFGMARSSTGALFVVGSDQDLPAGGSLIEADVAAVPTGFVGSYLYRLGSVLDPAPGIRNLNVDANGATVARSRAICQPTDVVIHRDSSGVERLFFTSFGTDRVGRISNLTAPAADWVVQTTEIVPADADPNAIAGPRGLAISYGAPGDYDDYVLVLNRVDNSISRIHVMTGARLVSVTSLYDPTPDYIRHGRKFLYDAKLSRSATVSCASCHIDGRLDGLAWPLSAQLDSGGPTLFDGQDELVQRLLDGFNDELFLPEIELYGFPEYKGNMVTQSLQGLVNQEADPATQAWFANAPYHWRGDRETFRDFHGAFASLLLGVVGSGPEPAVSDRDMEMFERFVNSISCPPNPDQPLDRRLQGSIGVIGDPMDGSGTLRALEAYHTVSLPGTTSCAGRSCVQCHSLPEGSNNRVTQSFFLTFPARQPLETPGWRGLRAKDLVLAPLGGVATNPQIELAGPGIFHTGGEDLDAFTSGFPLGAASNDMALFVRQLDTGLAPLVGRTITFDAASPTDALEPTILEQADLGYVGLAAQMWSGASFVGYWYDLADAAVAASGQRVAFVDEATGNRKTWDELKAEIGAGADRIVLHCTPVGSARRVALGGAAPAMLSGASPLLLQVLPMAPNTVYELVPQLRDNWDPLPATAGSARLFKWGGQFLSGQPSPEPESLRRIRMMQRALIPDFVPETRHDAPRHFRISGTAIRHGAVLEIDVGGDPAQRLRLPLFATGESTAFGTVWVTAVEAEPELYYQLMLGGPADPQVADLMDGRYPGELPPAGVFDAVARNRHTVRVVNTDGTSFERTGVPLTLTP